MLDGAKALAMTVADLWLRPEALDAVRAAFAGRRPAAAEPADGASRRTVVRPASPAPTVYGPPP